MEPMIYLVPLFFLAALVYATAGHGGGSTYLALMSLFSVPFTSLRQVALVCNIVVVIGGFYLFYQEGYFSPKKVVPFVLTSIPASFLCGRIHVGERLFALLLGLSLFVVALRMLFAPGIFETKQEVSQRKAWLIGLPLGALLGGLSGLIGIGGGIFLSPLLILLGWANPKETAAAASVFILVNSIAGLLGQWTRNPLSLAISSVLPLALAVFFGGQIGSRLGSKKISMPVLQKYTAILILYASGSLLEKLL